MVEELASKYGSTWKEVVGHPEYFVSQDGRAYSTKTHDLLVVSKVNQVTLYYDGQSRPHNLAALVYSAFVGEVPEDKSVGFIDGDHRNRAVENLCLVNRNNRGGSVPPESMEKRKDTIAAKLGIVKAYGPNGEYYEARTIRDMAAMVGYVGRSSIGDCCSGKRASCKGWQFERVKENDCAW